MLQTENDWNLNTRISGLVDTTVEEICSEYASNPYKFYTENDLVCLFYQTFNLKLGNYEVADVNGKKHSIVHTEYPTPFRCDMCGYEFCIKEDHDATPRGGKYGRGHYDVVILNPSFIQQLTRNELRAQNYELYKKNVLPKIYPGNPIVLYGLEFIFNRNKVNSSNSAEILSKIIMQDHNKLIQSANPYPHTLGHSGFMLKYKTLVFFESNGYSEHIEKRLDDKENIKLCYPAHSII